MRKPRWRGGDDISWLPVSSVRRHKGERSLRPTHSIRGGWRTAVQNTQLCKIHSCAKYTAVQLARKSLRKYRRTIQRFLLYYSVRFARKGRNSEAAQNNIHTCRFAVWGQFVGATKISTDCWYWFVKERAELRKWQQLLDWSRKPQKHFLVLARSKSERSTRFEIHRWTSLAKLISQGLNFAKQIPKWRQLLDWSRTSPKHFLALARSPLITSPSNSSTNGKYTFSDNDDWWWF